MKKYLLKLKIRNCKYIISAILCILSPLIGEWLGTLYAFINYKLGILSIPYGGEVYTILSTIGLIIAALLLIISTDKKSDT